MNLYEAWEDRQIRHQFWMQSFDTYHMLLSKILRGMGLTDDEYILYSRIGTFLSNQYETLNTDDDKPANNNPDEEASSA